jgi:hypothetical protein
VSDLGGGKYHIVAETNFAPVKSPETAEKMWSKAAVDACSGEDYTEEDTRVYSY